MSPYSLMRTAKALMRMLILAFAGPDCKQAFWRCVTFYHTGRHTETRYTVTNNLLSKMCLLDDQAQFAHAYGHQWPYEASVEPGCERESATGR